ncbi:hypothetical protein Csa_022662 [Cucumis sativus]|nr:hypothetical protein Csa_022662 [Cucumis sativus]
MEVLICKDRLRFIIRDSSLMPYTNSIILILVRDHQLILHSGGFSLSMGVVQNCDHTMSLVEYNKGERCKNSASDEDPSFNEDSIDGHNENSKGRRIDVAPREMDR